MIRILIVEDNPIVGRATGRALSRRFDVVDVVNDATTALRRLEIDGVDVVITDHDLGGVSVTGIELARIIRQRWPRVPVVLVSGSIDDSLRETARAAGIAACFMKPASMEELTAEVRRLCDTNEWVATRVQD